MALVVMFVNIVFMLLFWYYKALLRSSFLIRIIMVFVRHIVFNALSTIIASVSFPSPKSTFQVENVWQPKYTWKNSAKKTAKVSKKSEMCLESKIYKFPNFNKKYAFFPIKNGRGSFEKRQQYHWLKLPVNQLIGRTITK